RIMQLSNDVVHTQDQLNEQKKVNDTLEKNLETRTTEAQGLSNKLETVTTTLTRTEQEAKAAAEQAKDQIAKRDAKIADLEGQNDDLSKKMTDLNTSITSLESQIDNTKKKLAASEGDRDFLLNELKRLQTEKAELERKFNDLAVLRDQVRKLRDELSIARRLEWIRRGLYGSEKAADFYRVKFDALKNPSPPTPITREWKPRSQILTFEEIERVVRLAAQLGIEKVRVTGGEPLLRHGLESLVARLAQIPGVTDLAMTTNGFLFPQKGRTLREAGLQRVSFSLDSLDPANFKRIAGRDGLRSVLASIDLAQELGFRPVKANAVIIRGLNDHEIESLTDFARQKNLSFRFIEFMPLDSGRAWQK